MRRIRSPCCARATSGHAAAAPPSTVMNSRRLISASSSGDGILSVQVRALIGAEPTSLLQHEMLTDVRGGVKMRKTPKEQKISASPPKADVAQTVPSKPPLRLA